MKIISKLNPELNWNIKTDRELTTEEVSFIEQFSPIVYHNDRECYLWAFDTKMPTGAWLENMRFNNEMTECRALVM